MNYDIKNKKIAIYYVNKYPTDKYTIYPELFQDIYVFENNINIINKLENVRDYQYKQLKPQTQLQEIIDEIVLSAEVKYMTFTNITNKVLFQILHKLFTKNTVIHLVIVPSHENNENITNYKR